MKQYILAVDLDRCIGCNACRVSCKMENGTALGSSRNKVLTIGPTGTYPDIEMYFLPVMCQQCAEPSCVKACPTGACYRNSDDGVILIDQNNCIGCMSCKRACPYDIMTFNNEMRVMDKCTLCVDSRENGDKPACVKNCSGRALIFGDINDPDSDVSIVLKKAGSENIFSLRDSSGNHPSVRYILRRDKWHDVLPQECEENKWRRK